MGVPLRELSLHDFLEWENAQPDRNEFVRGEVFAMTGGRRMNGQVVANLMRHLGNQLDGSPCKVFCEAMKVQVAEDTVLYPDVFVTCDRGDLASDVIFHAPIVVIEVLSPSTQAYDRSQKFALYRRLESLREYVLIDPDTRRVEAFRRNTDGAWILDDMTDAGQLSLRVIEASVSLSDVFYGLEPGSQT